MLSLSDNNRPDRSFNPWQNPEALHLPANLPAAENLQDFKVDQ